MNNFYYVYNRAQGKPVKRHKTEQEAIDEAVRLSKLHHKNFYVLKPSFHVIYDHETNKIVLDNENTGKFSR